MAEGEVIFDGSEDIEDWNSVDTVTQDQQDDFNDFDLEFIDTDDVEEDDYWVGEYSGTREIGDAQSASVIFDDQNDEISYAFPSHVMLKSQVEDAPLSENQTRAENPIEKGETVAIVYQGTTELDDRPMDMHVWELRRPPE